MTEQNEFPIRATLKAGGGYDAPWLTVAGETANDVLFKLKDIQDQGLSAVVAETAKVLAGVWTASDVLGARQQSASQPAPAPQGQRSGAPVYDDSNNSDPSLPPVRTQQAVQDQPAPQCRHGERKFVTSKPNASPQWKAWMCPTPQGATDKCAPQWIRD